MLLFSAFLTRYIPNYLLHVTTKKHLRRRVLLAVLGILTLARGWWLARVQLLNRIGEVLDLSGLHSNLAFLDQVTFSIFSHQCG
jgi:hypothetical protein